MILRCLFVTVTRNRKGRPVRTSTLVAGDPISIGRGSENSIRLGDPRVHLRHGIIRNDDQGKLYVEALEAPIEVNGKLERRAKLRRGWRILIGPYQITPEPATSPDHDFGLAIELVQPLPDEANDFRERSRTLLSATWLSKRGLAWAGFAAAALVGAALPVAYATSPAFREEAAVRFPEPLKRVAWDVIWDPGPLSRGHQSLARQCQACHQTPFEAVQDPACVKCHARTGEHLAAASVQAGVSLGTRCAECHRDHRGESAMVRTDPRFCVDCHGDIKRRHPRATLAGITDFASDHPPFSLSMVNPRTGEVERVAADRLGPGGEASGLKFPHAKHLAREGIRSPSGLRVLACSQCHRPNDEGTRFAPVTMAGHCSECHRLEFEPAVTSRQVPHGDLGGILTTLREFYARIAIGERPIDVTLVNGLLRSPVERASREERERALAWADGKALTVATELIESRVCVQCHLVSRRARDAPPFMDRIGEPSWTIEPVAITARWLPGVDFDHRSHQQAACEKCHDVSASRSSADIAIPALATCRSCHAGAVAVKGKVRSPCETCHSFHQHLQPLSPAPISAPAPVATSPAAPVLQ